MEIKSDFYFEKAYGRNVIVCPDGNVVQLWISLVNWQRKTLETCEMVTGYFVAWVQMSPPWRVLLVQMMTTTAHSVSALCPQACVISID